MRRQIKPLLLIAATSTLLALPGGPVSAEGQARNPPPQASPPAVQQMACADRNEIVRALREMFGEKPVAHGLADSGILAAIFASPQGTWTIVATNPNCVSCLIGSGQLFQTTAALDEAI
jgi:hypothetical protein